MDAQTERGAARVGTVLKQKWHIDRLIGAGGMASVYAATHRNGKRVAIKVLHPELSLNESIRQRFLREGYLANAVAHSGAVAVDDDDVAEDGSAFLVMELLEGETFDTRAQRKGGRLSQPEVLSLVDQVLDTLAAAHAQGIVHRDLKPENLFLTRDGRVKILDFGIAGVRQLSGNVTPTQTDAMMGTPAFMPPEQALSRWDEVDFRSDLWALGATLFTLLTGRFVHQADTVTESLVLAATCHAPSVWAVDASLHPAVVALVDRSLAYSKADRFSDVLEMQNALRAAYPAVVGEEYSSAEIPSSPLDSEHEAQPLADEAPSAEPPPSPPSLSSTRAYSAEVFDRVAARLHRSGLPMVAVVPVLLGFAALVLIAIALATRGNGGETVIQARSADSTLVTRVPPLPKSMVGATPRVSVAPATELAAIPTTPTTKDEAEPPTKRTGVESVPQSPVPSAVGTPRHAVRALPVELPDEDDPPKARPAPELPKAHAAEDPFSARF